MLSRHGRTKAHKISLDADRALILFVIIAESAGSWRIPLTADGVSWIGGACARSGKATEANQKTAGIYTTAGDIARRMGDFARGLKFYEAATAILSKIFSNNPANAGARERLAATYNSVGNTQLRRHNFAVAGIAFRKALALAEPVASSNHSNGQAFYTTADAYAGLRGGAQFGLESTADENEPAEALGRSRLVVPQESRIFRPDQRTRIHQPRWIRLCKSRVCDPPPL